MIHSTAIVHKNAIIGQDVEIGAYCIIGDQVKLGDRVILKSHVVVEGPTEIGEDTIIYPFAAIGTKGQDLKFQEDDQMSGVKIGKRNRIREYATIQQGTPASKGTIVGDDCQIMINAHVAHDCILGNNIILSNVVQLAGHVEVEDFAIVSGMAAVHQFCRIGKYAIVGGVSGVANDVLPYSISDGRPAIYKTLNRVGLSRHGIGNDDMHAIYEVYKALFDKSDITSSVASRLKEIRKKVKDSPYAMDALDFIENRSKRGATDFSKRE
ncbi:MAG: acyl-ACP--UDP-N-acetylglucosamine O-acyltransferase [Rickettsiales bacterium]|jgi:UDP-N-acetylglucosamine acyltransferase|nr:acyl-ACP--UDP-N-acetylglucosamine O-acyltransferase [Rickettsiales bacterium]